jgi:hypothetical protein
MDDFIVEMKKDSTVRYLLVAGADSRTEAVEIAKRYSISFGVPLTVRRVSANHFEPEPPISLYIPRLKL